MILLSLEFMAAMEVEERSENREWEECRTPRHIENQIPAIFMCPPPPPRKKPIGGGRRREPPKNGYFQPPDLDSFFAIPARN